MRYLRGSFCHVACLVMGGRGLLGEDRLLGVACKDVSEELGDGIRGGSLSPDGCSEGRCAKAGTRAHLLRALFGMI